MTTFVSCTMTDEQQHRLAVKFIFKCCPKLNLNDTTLSSACVLYHRFYNHCEVEDYDQYTIAATAIYLATKVEEQHTRLRDIVNVCHRTKYPSRPLLELNLEFWNLRDTIAACELFMMRVLKFEVTYVHPHKYLLHYLMSLSNLFRKRDWRHYPISDTAWSILRDSFLSSSCLEHAPQLHAIAAIDLALQCCKVEVPLSKHAKFPWWKALYDACSYKDIVKVQVDMVDVYEIVSAEPS
ncbi:cyclin-Q-like [Clavelina lepadiformis]|uniref:cyclin-Q-like n=1 Tax=Clavelina lepadiformis TaxID=159417 RepID=UPI0040423937